jgi:tetratricopeptide (TPR) repeat protein
MNIRLVIGVALLLSSYTHCQQTLQSSEAGQPTRVTATDSSEYKQQLLRRIALEETSLREAESSHRTDVVLGRLYVRLGLLYQETAWWERSEAALAHAVSLLRRSSGPSRDLANAITQLGKLHVVMGKRRESEREELESLKLRQDLGDRLQIAHSWNDLAVLYLKEQKFAKARDFAQQAEAEFAANRQATALDRVTVRSVLSEALCSLKDCASAIPLLTAALGEARTAFQPDDFTIGLCDYLLGDAYWKSGDIPAAEEHMKRGTTQMSAQLGWGHPVYLNALKHYALFLRQNQRMEAANVVERQIRQAEAVVDVRAIPGYRGALGFDGVH